MTVSSSISVIVVDGAYSALQKLGFPLPALASMQDSGLHLKDACWDVKKSLTGFSVSFFWPASPAAITHISRKNKSNNKSKRRRRQGKNGKNSKDDAVMKRGDTMPSMGSPSCQFPFDAHHSSNNAPPSLHLAEKVVEMKCDAQVVEKRSNPCEPVQEKKRSVTEMESEAVISKLSLSDVTIEPSADVYYHEVDDTPGLCVDHSDGSSTWSPIKITRQAVKPASADVSESELEISECLSIDFQLRNNVPGVEIESSNDNDVFWVPVAHRTRSRKKSPSTT